MRGPRGRRPPSFKHKRSRTEEESEGGETKMEFNNNGDSQPIDDKPNLGNQNHQDTQETMIVKVSLNSTEEILFNHVNVTEYSIRKTLCITNKIQN